MKNRVMNLNRLILAVSLLGLLGGYPAGPCDVFAQTNRPAAQTTDEYGFYVPPTDRSPYRDVDDLHGKQMTRVKNVILMIGDGMGLAQVAAARIRAVGPDGRLHMDRMPVTGFVTTHSEQLVTDSAAGATALATGYKTNNGMVSVRPDGRRLLTILEAARDKKMATGLTVVSPIPHATPAAFAAHEDSRNSYPKIFKQMLEAKVDVLFGSGDAGTTTQPSADATRARKAGYRVISNRKDLRSATDTPIIGLLGIEEPSAASPDPMLAEMTAKAIELLGKKPNGFFLMVEGSDIDWAGHANDPAGAIRKTLLFDLAIKEALEFARKDGHTLVVVTADHETGGMAIVGGSTHGKDIESGWATKGHTGIPVPLYAYGPGARRFMGVRDNTEIPRIIAQLLEIKEFPRIYPKK